MLTALEPADGEAILPLDLLKERVRVLSSDEDGDIARMRDQAIDLIERTLGKSLQVRQFQWSGNQFASPIRLPMGPVISVDSVIYYASDGTDTPLDPADWLFSDDCVQAAIGTSWPTASDVPGSVRVIFTAGYEDAEADAPLLISAVEVAVAAIRKDRAAPNLDPSLNVGLSYWSPAL